MINFGLRKSLRMIVRRDRRTARSTDPGADHPIYMATQCRARKGMLDPLKVSPCVGMQSMVVGASRTPTVTKPGRTAPEIA